VRLVKLVVVVYVVVGLMLAAFQTKLIFIGAATQGKPEAVVDPPPLSELVRMRAADGAEVVGLFGRSVDGAEAARRRPTVLFFYGNAMCMKDAVDNFHMFRHLGVNCMVVDYEGFGMSGGKPSESGCYAAAEATYQHLLGRRDIDTKNIVPAGWSLGGAVAIDLAAKHAGEGRISGVMTFSAFTSMVDTAQHHYPVFPVSLLLVHRFDSLSKIGRVDVPVLLGHGRRDEIVPFWMHERLVKGARTAVTEVVLDHAGHNDFFDADEETLNGAVKGFLDARTAREPPMNTDEHR
jgi:pimeloyl-ACP methyl ester carboxylesterase